MASAKRHKDKLIFDLINNPNYQISEDGTILTNIQKNGAPGASWRDATSLNDKGYRLVWFQGTRLRVHRIIWAKFKGYLTAKLVINHLDGNRSNNRIENLELVSEGTNQVHRYRVLGRNPNRGAARLSWATVDQIRNDRRNGYTLKKLKEKYDLPSTTLSEICSGKTYREELKDGKN